MHAVSFVTDQSERVDKHVGHHPTAVVVPYINAIDRRLHRTGPGPSDGTSEALVDW